jgi:glycosyltransferase involved in cell wall biosynthesis
MKICYLADPESIQTQRWLRYFVDRGHEVFLLTKDDKKNSGIPGVKSYSFKPKYEEFFLKLNWRFYLFLKDRKIKRMINQIKPDIIHAHYITGNGWWAARSGFHPFVLTPWGSDIYKDALGSSQFRKRVHYALKSADLITVNSKDLKKVVISLGANPSKIEPVQFGVDFNEFHPFPDKKSLKEKLGLGEVPIVLSNRGFKPLYNIDIIIKSIPLVIKEIPEVKFIFVWSGGEEKKNLMSLANELNVKDKVIFVGQLRVEEMVKFYNIADVFVSIASWDGISKSLLESMACGVAPVVSRFPSNLEWITDRVNGCVVPMRDERKTAEAIIYLLKNPEARIKYARLNQEIVKERTDYHKHMGRMEELYISLLNYKRG